MARTFNRALGTRAAPNNGEYLQVAPTAMPISAYPVTLFVWMRPLSYLGNTNAAGCGAVCVSNPAAAGTEALYLQLNGSGQVSATAASGGAFNSATATTGVPPGQWAALAGVFTSSSLRTAWANGALQATNTTATAYPTGMTTLTVGILALGQTGNFLYAPCTGDTLFPAIWNADLTPNELTALAQGADPLLIRRDNLVGCWDDFGRDRTQRGNHMTTVLGRPVSTKVVHQHPEGLRPVRTYGARRVLRAS